MYESSHENVVWKSLQALEGWVLPAPCLACESSVERPRDSLGLCGSCRRRLEAWPEDRCADCGERGGEVEGRCMPCTEAAPPWHEVACAWIYRAPLDSVVAAMKFRRLDYLGQHLARSMIRQLGAKCPEVDLVAAVPLHWSRRLRRGFNQAEIMARQVARDLDVPYGAPLYRRRRTRSQSQGLGREDRMRNLEEAFAPRWLARCHGQRILLVDDVMTSGATLWAACSALRRAGAEKITVWAAARTPGEGL